MTSRGSSQVGLDWLLQPWLDKAPVAEVSGVCADSRDIKPGDLFAALLGDSRHGLEFSAQAIEQGAAAIAWEPGQGVSLDTVRRKTADSGVPLVEVPQLGRRLGSIAARLYGDPSQQLEVAAVTGTDGKTSVTHFIAQLLSEQSSPWGVIGTLGYGLPGRLELSRLTTPDSAQLQQAFFHCQTAGCSGVALEASSHALEQGRLAAAKVDVAILTHLGRDHLDYHGSPEAYADAKRRLFEINSLRAQIINLDDEFGQRLRESAGGAVFTYSLQNPEADIHAVSVEPQPYGSDVELRVGKTTYKTSVPLLGRFNVANALAAVGVALALGRPLEDVIGKLPSLQPVAGRMERFIRPGYPLVVVDYAHTPGSLQYSLEALRQHCQGKVTVVFGCGGERDTGKRPLMGQVAAHHADAVWITDDNPRGEDAEQIRRAISQGARDCANSAAISVQPDRAQAIQQAIAHAGADDAVLVAGKGHESTQQIGAEYIPFSDREVVLAALEPEEVRRCCP
ncbi:UDP-N-acetylmuramoyl-L-alanyl-D-glutamate--2,6-diaminopimelate ligase [Halorhodospira halochloris]|uniref:UDP-N-acetylmuramoyl-L-alanyl-D-glutamate--2, 6-diaminopimelate ligase n=1 Tax=Halorhodospira halochloris TaxID=1052 RepID=UPI001EE91FAC|nr:UDP-N-acetylmuramoyl-L-alanyl-D-glutamate--2,6-diaminopimelate ligase [Halorhodospira halochloris]MCG5529575.1 UDP-N-acetylmuramoyl-L-alanyl-D-glutamate--2,6-diaminopimelate ligase [Halorhodospira halochloris]